jgi:hypothetical protein
MAYDGSHLFLDEGLDEFCRIVCTTIEDLDGTFPEHVALCIQVKRILSCHSCIFSPDSQCFASACSISKDNVLEVVDHPQGSHVHEWPWPIVTSCVARPGQLVIQAKKGRFVFSAPQSEMAAHFISG